MNDENQTQQDSEGTPGTAVNAANDSGNQVQGEGQPGTENPTSANAPATSDTGQAAAEGSPANAATDTASQPKPHEDGGATLQQQATAAGPQLLASVDVYRDSQGTFYLNLTHNTTGNAVTLPQQRTAESAEVRGAVDLFLTEHLPA